MCQVVGVLCAEPDHCNVGAAAGAATRLMRSVSCMGSSQAVSRRTSWRARLRDSASSAHTWSSCSMPSSSGAATIRNTRMICAASTSLKVGLICRSSKSQGSLLGRQKVKPYMQGNTCPALRRHLLDGVLGVDRVAGALMTPRNLPVTRQDG